MRGFLERARECCQLALQLYHEGLHVLGQAVRVGAREQPIDHPLAPSQHVLNTCNGAITFAATCLVL